MHADLVKLLDLQSKDAAIDDVDRAGAGSSTANSEPSTGPFSAHGTHSTLPAGPPPTAAAGGTSSRPRWRATGCCRTGGVQRLETVRNPKEASTLMAELDLARSVMAKEETDWVRSAEAVTAARAQGRRGGEQGGRGRARAGARARAARGAEAGARGRARGGRCGSGKRAPSRSTSRSGPATTGCGARARRDVVVPLVGGTCGACHTSVPLNRRSQIRSGAMLDGCEGCGAILYPAGAGGVGMNAGGGGTLPLVSVFPAPVLRWVIAPPPDPAAVDRLAAGSGIPAAAGGAAGAARPGQPKRPRARSSGPPSTGLSDPDALAGMAEAVDAIAAAVRAGGTILVHGDYDVDGQCATALLTRALRAAGRGRRRRSCRTGCATATTSARPASPRRNGAGASLIVTCDCGITAVDTVRAARGGGHRRRRHRPPPARRRAAAGARRRRSAARRTTRPARARLCGTGIAFKLVQALVPALGLPPNLPLPPARSRRARHRGRRGAAGRREPHPGPPRAPAAGRQPVAGPPGAGRRPAGWQGRSSAPGTWASSSARGSTPRAGSATRPTGSRLLLTDDPDEAARLARRLEGLNVERQALDQRILEEALAQVEQAGDPERDAGFVLAGEGWHPGVVGIVASRVVERYGRPTFLIAFDGDIGKGSGRSISRFDLHAALLGLRRSARALRRPPDGRRAHHPARPARRVPRAVRRRSRGSRSARTTSAPSSGWTSRCGSPRPRDELERLCRHLEPCGVGNPSPVFGVRGRAASPAASRVGNGHLKGVLDDGTDAARRRSAFSGPTGCRGWATGRSTRRSGSSRTSGTGTRRCRRGCARSRRTADRDLSSRVTLSAAKGA